MSADERQPKQSLRRGKNVLPAAPVAPRAESVEPPILDAEATAAALIFLFGARFGGQPERRAFRAAQSSIREISGRPRLGAAFLDEVAMHLARAGYDFVRMETYVVVQQASRHDTMRRAPASLRTAARRAAIDGSAKVISVTSEEEDESDER